MPIIDGHFQEEGGGHAARVVESLISEARDTLVVEIAPAYGDANLGSPVRSFVFIKDNPPHLLLEDAFAFTQPPLSVAERFISFCKAVVLPNGRIRLDGRRSQVEIEYRQGEMHLAVGKEVFATQEGAQRTVYTIDLIHDGPATRFNVCVKFLLIGMGVGSSRQTAARNGVNGSGETARETTKTRG